MSGTKATIASVFDRLQSRDKVRRPATSCLAQAHDYQVYQAYVSSVDAYVPKGSLEKGLSSQDGICTANYDSDAQPSILIYKRLSLQVTGKMEPSLIVK